ncbi:MAG: saccharopine dehydrogenase C-terminal domain-containing protein [bacterium]
MKVVVFGASGKVGGAMAWDLVKFNKDVDRVGIVGRRKEALEATRAWIKSDKIVPHAVDVGSKEEIKQAMKGYDVGIVSMPTRRASYKVAEAAIEAKLNIVDVLEEYHRRPDLYEVEGLEIKPGMSIHDYGEWLHNRAAESGVTFMSGIGFAPGMSNITVGEAIRKLDTAEIAFARVGGIPAKEASTRHPLKYMITWAFSHVLREYMVKLQIIKGGKIVDVNAMTDYERFRFNKFGKDEEIECFVTPGMPSFIYTRPHLKEFAEKTCRWPGHWQGVQTLKECGLLDITPMDVNGVEVVPREALLASIEPRLRANPGETDVCVMYNTVIGTKNGKKTKIEYFMWDEADKVNNISSMARVTGFSAAIGAVHVGRGQISGKGIVAPEDCYDSALYKEFISELERRNVRILEEITTV